MRCMTTWVPRYHAAHVRSDRLCRAVESRRRIAASLLIHVGSSRHQPPSLRVHTDQPKFVGGIRTAPLGTTAGNQTCRHSAVRPSNLNAECHADHFYAVLDLPQLYTKPSAEALLDTLAQLTTAPPSWDRQGQPAANNEEAHHVRETDETAIQIDPEGVTRYLTSVVSNSLAWIQDDATREDIWNQASVRLSERSGRTAMGDLDRKFTIPTRNDPLELSIHEPALTGDDLGLKTWAASYLLAKRLHTLECTLPTEGGRVRVLELGSGTGLVGLAMAGLGAHVVLTDLPSIHSNLSRNVEANRSALEQRGGSVSTGVLDWTTPQSCTLFPRGIGGVEGGGDELTEKFRLILAADSLYSPHHPRLLVDTIAVWLSEDGEARVVVEFPYREAYLPEIADFRARMAECGLQMMDEGEEEGYDDWGGSSEDRDGLVTCWWSCWRRKVVEQEPH